jgi:hypothetical protein
MRGKLTEVSVNEVSGNRFGSISIDVVGLSINLIVGRDSKGEIPEVGSHVSIKYEDSEVPRIVEIDETSDTTAILPVYTHKPKNPWLVRWPKSCMFCGEPDLSKLSVKADYWSTEIGKSKVVGEETATTALKVINSILLSIFTPAPGSSAITKKKMYFSVNLPIEMYTCKECKRIKPRFSDSMTISLAPKDDNKVSYHFEFKSQKYEEYFRELNPNDIEPKIDVQQR